MLRPQVIIEDDSGNKVPLFNEGLLPKFSGEKAGRVAGRAYDGSRHRQLGLGEIVVMSSCGVIMLMALAMNGLGVWRHRPDEQVLIAAMVACAPLMLLSIHFMRKKQSRRLRAALLSAKLCPSCGYDIPTAPDPATTARPGLVQCPECGSWWNAPRA